MGFDSDEVELSIIWFARIIGIVIGLAILGSWFANDAKLLIALIVLVLCCIIAWYVWFKKD